MKQWMRLAACWGLLLAPTWALAKGRPAAPSAWGSLGRSVVLPGWGQWASGEHGRAYVVGGATLGLFAGGWASYASAESAADRYLGYGPGTTQAQFDDAYGQWESSANLNHVLVSVFAAAYTYNLIDAYLAPGRAARAQATALSLVPLVRPGGATGAALVGQF